MLGLGNNLPKVIQRVVTYIKDFWQDQYNVWQDQNTDWDKT